MSSTICLDLESYDNAVRHGAWEETGVMRTWLYPENTEEFAAMLEDSDAVEHDGSGTDSDTYTGTEGTYRHMLERLPEPLKAIFPKPPTGWEDTQPTITILW
ncbi:hypothetical protein [Bifidobacterium biavatii]|uniref:Uncharacterized protein n=1 Tax=Bifidobacterium biavatii DSM 23969 TaxID=1437608 RepID=A0A086ZHX3_9BIFI|nr:hypothetical protein [Bifidobacterium biavatii]KFI46123.1 hypothetical protein BBIA_2088 [Bifidobacterium biavatii DSM 23969]